MNQSRFIFLLSIVMVFIGLEDLAHAIPDPCAPQPASVSIQDIVPCEPNPIPTLSELAKILMVLGMVGTVGWYSRRAKQ